MGRLFGTDGIRGVANNYPMTPEVALQVGKAAARVFRRKRKGRNAIIIGKDPRLSGYMLEGALMSGICSDGCDALLTGPIPTPAIAYLTRKLGVRAGIMISASHNPSEDNGIKFFSPDGFKLSRKLEAQIESLVFSDEINTEHIKGSLIGKASRVEDARRLYIDHCKRSVRNLSLKNVRVVVDGANGAAYRVAPMVFEELGAEVIAIGDRPDGLNINEKAGAMDPGRARRVLRKYTADLAVCLDGDADRLILIDDMGRAHDGDDNMYSLASHMKSRRRLANDTLVTTVVSNMALEDALRERGVRTVRTDVGDRYVVEAMVRRGLVLGGEQSGHIIDLRHSTTGDGIIAALQVLRVMKERGERLSKLGLPVERYPQIFIDVPVGARIPLENLPRTSSRIRHHTRALGRRGRILVRYSGTQKVARVMTEGRDRDEIRNIAQDIAETLGDEVGPS